MNYGYTDDVQHIRFDIAGARPSYSISESEDPDGYEEDLSLMLKVQATTDIPGLPSTGIIHVKGLRHLELIAMRLPNDDTSVGVGSVRVLPDNIAIEALVPFDAAWHLASVVKAGHIGVVRVHCDTIAKVGDRAFLRGLDLLPG